MLTSVVVKFNDTSDHLLYLCPTKLLSLASLLAEGAVIVEDTESLERHCREIETECKKKKPDSSKCFRLLALTIGHRRKWLMTLTPPNRVALNIVRFNCLKDPDMVINIFSNLNSPKISFSFTMNF